MHREGLFFDPLQGEDADPRVEPAPPRTEPRRRRGPDAGERQERRRQELARVQDELRKLAEGSAPAAGAARGRRRPGTGDR
jgi:hypothetical protein